MGSNCTFPSRPSRKLCVAAVKFNRVCKGKEKTVYGCVKVLHTCLTNERLAALQSVPVYITGTFCVTIVWVHF